MKLTGETRLSQALDGIPGALEYVVGLNPHDFARLRNPFMRKYMSPRISLRRLAQMVGMTEAALLADLAALADGAAEMVAAPDSAPAAKLPASPAAPPAWMADVDEARLHWIDVLPIDAVLGDPLLPINLGVKRMAPGTVVGIRHRWEPQPLYDVWTKLGLEWFAHQAGPDEWRIFVHKPPTARAIAPDLGTTLELRRLPPDEPAPRTVAMFEQLGIGDHLELWLDDPAVAERVRSGLDERHAGAYAWDEQAGGSDKRVVRVRRTA